MMSIIGRMNPAVCLGGGSSTLDDVVDDVPEVTGTEDSSSSPESSNDAKRKMGVGGGGISKKGSSFACSTGCNSRYHPDDMIEPLPADVVLKTLSRTVPDLLRCISTPPPTTFQDGASDFDIRKTVREFNAKRTAALQKMYDLTKKGNEHNRVLLISKEERWDVLGVLSKALLASIERTSTDDTTNSKQTKGKKSVDEDRRLICWTINNLSIPYENKEAIALGEHSAKLLRALTTVIQSNLPETYLCCICLLNLTFLADAIRPISFYVPSSYDNGRPPYSPSRSSSGRPPASPFSKTRSKNRSFNGKKVWSESEGRISEIVGLVLGNSSSLIRVIERMMVVNAPFLQSNVQSVQGEAIRWSCGFIRNVTYAGEARKDDDSHGDDSLSGTSGRQGDIHPESIEEICILISQTEIPRLMVQFLKESSRPTVQWTKDSLEDICLGAMCNMAQWQSSREALRRAGALGCLEKIEGLPGIHGYRARAIKCSLGALPTKFG